MEPSLNTHKGPHLGMLASLFTGLFLTGLYFVISFSADAPHYPGPWESLTQIETYFQNNSHSVMRCAFFQFGAAIPLGIFTATVVSRLRFLGVQAAGSYIALFGGFATSFSLIISSLLVWAMSYPAVFQHKSAIGPLYYIGFAIGGVGYSVPLGLLTAGISVTAYLAKLLPKWLSIVGLLVALVGELSWLTLVFPSLLPLIPLTRFPGFIWLILVGFKLPQVAESPSTLRPSLEPFIS